MAQSLGEKIRKVREFRKISLEDLSKKTGYSKEFLGGLEDGSRMTTLGTLMVIAKGMGLRVGTFLDDNEKLGPAVMRKSERGSGVRFAARTESVHGDLSFLPLAHDQAVGIWNPLSSTLRHQQPKIISFHNMKEKNLFTFSPDRWKSATARINSFWKRAIRFITIRLFLIRFTAPAIRIPVF